MDCDTLKLKAKVVERGMTMEQYAEAIGIDMSTLYRKINGGGRGFTIGQMHKTVDVLGLSNPEAIAIFLPDNSQKCEKTDEEGA